MFSSEDIVVFENIIRYEPIQDVYLLMLSAKFDQLTQENPTSASSLNDLYKERLVSEVDALIERRKRADGVNE